MEKKTLAILVILVLAISVVAVGASYSYFSDRAEVGDNTFSTGVWEE